ncbi:MAG: hypothetical protein RI956_398 [Pseudomonadota bacterium]
MKKIYSTFTIILFLTTVVVNAQVTKDKSIYNKLSFEVGAGFNRFYEYNTLTPKPSLFTVDLGLRYMFNPKFGIKGDIGYNSIATNADTNMKTKYYRLGLEGVVNVGRIANFETWTNRIGLLAHLGAGYGQLRYQSNPIVDHVINIKAGVTVQLKLSERIALYADISTIPSYSHDFTYDGNVVIDHSSRMGMLNGTGGLVFYLDENEKHMDWVSEQEDNTEVIELRNRIDVLNQSLNDTDRDGVLDSLDLEPNTVAGVTVDSRGRSIDTNNNGVSDEIEKQFKALGTTETPSMGSDAKNLIDKGYVSVYFDFNRVNPTSASYDKIDFVLNYLKTNPNANVEITGYADEIGNELYNLKLSANRADAVKDILVKSGISESRITVSQGGVDNSVDKNSAEARKLVRKVIFKLK